MFCEQVATELDIIMSHDPRDGLGFMEHAANKPLYPVSMASYASWVRRGEDRVRDALRSKHGAVFANKLAQGGSGKPAQGDDLV